MGFKFTCSTGNSISNTWTSRYARKLQPRCFQRRTMHQRKTSGPYFSGSRWAAECALDAFLGRLLNEFSVESFLKLAPGGLVERRGKGVTR